MPNAKDFRSWRLQKLADPEIAKGYLNDALSESWDMFLKAVLNVAQARQVAVVADEAGVTRENIYRAFCEGGNPKADTLNAVLGVCGLEIRGIDLKDSRKSESASTALSVGHRRPRRSSRKRRILGDVRQLGLPFSPLNVETAANSSHVPTGAPNATYNIADRWQGTSSLSSGLQYLYINQEDAGASETSIPLADIHTVCQQFVPFELRK